MVNMVTQKGDEGVSQPVASAVIVHTKSLKQTRKFVISVLSFDIKMTYLSTNLVATLTDLDMDDFTHNDLI